MDRLGEGRRILHFFHQSGEDAPLMIEGAHGKYATNDPEVSQTPSKWYSPQDNHAYQVPQKAVIKHCLSCTTFTAVGTDDNAVTT